MSKKIILMVVLSLFVLPNLSFAQVASTTLTGGTTEEKVRNYFADIPVMIEIARCESKFRQFADSGNVLRGGLGGTMLGVFQFSEAYHLNPASKLGFDITTLEGNLAYARYVYTQSKTTPWIDSFSCWNAESTENSNSGSGNLSLGMISNEVLELQKLLNKTDFKVASFGPGSPGEETTKFGSLTYSALKKFQCAKNIACSGDEYSTGYGLYNSKTKEALISAASNGSADIETLKAKIAELTALVLKLQAQLAEMNR